MDITTHVAQRLWLPARNFYQSSSMCYTDYLTELSWLWWLKVAPARGLSTACSWDILTSLAGQSQYEYYSDILSHFQSPLPIVQTLFAEAKTHLKTPDQLALLISTLSHIDPLPQTDSGEVYDTLLEIYARENHSGLLRAPRPLLDLMVILTQPQLEETIQDPFAGTGHFIVAVNHYLQVIQEEIQFNSSNLSGKSNFSGQVMGKEQNRSRQRLALMNCLLHGIFEPEKLPVLWEDSLLIDLQTWPKADVIFSVLTSDTDVISNQHDASLASLHTLYQMLKPGGRAAVIVPDQLLSAAGPAHYIRQKLLDHCVVHTVLKLPLGLFYPHAMAAHVLFFYKSQNHGEGTEYTWCYDARSRAPILGQYVRLTREQLQPFELVYGEDPLGKSVREEGERWRCFTRSHLAAHQDRLDLHWLPDQSPDSKVHRAWSVLEDTLGELETLSELLKG